MIVKADYNVLFIKKNYDAAERPPDYQQLCSSSTPELLSRSLEISATEDISLQHFPAPPKKHRRLNYLFLVDLTPPYAPLWDTHDCNV